MKIAVSLRTKWLFLAALALSLFFALAWQPLTIGIAALSSERRPALLHHAEWGKPDPTFNQRFSNGTSEAKLLRWLSDNQFENIGDSSATRTVHGVPCNELVEVSWLASDGTIQESSAVVSEAGCL